MSCAAQLNHTESYLLVKDVVKRNPVSIEPNFGQDYDPFSEEPAPHVAMEKARLQEVILQSEIVGGFRTDFTK